MNAFGRITSLWFALALLAPVLPAQAQQPQTKLEDIEATGDLAEVIALNIWAEDNKHTYPQQARVVAERALALAREIGDLDEQGASLTTLGHLSTSSPYQAETYFMEATRIFEESGNDFAYVRSLINVGNVFWHQERLEEALRYYFSALENFERRGDTEGRATALNNIGLLHQSQGEAEAAQQFFEQAISLAETLDNHALLVNSLNILGSFLSGQGVYDRAEVVLRRALALSEEHGLRYFSAAISNNLGAVFSKQGHFEQALPYLFAAERHAREVEATIWLGAAYDELAKAYMGLGQFDQALHYGYEALAMAREMESFSYQMEAHQTLSRIYQTADDAVQALVHHQLYAAARDSVFNTERAGIIAEMLTRYETEEGRRAIERLEQQNQIQTLRQTLLLFGVASLLLLLGFLYYRYRTKQKANRLLEELDMAKSRFFANISHEFRTPLTVILGGLQDALAGRFGETSTRLTDEHQTMLRNTRQLQRLINEVLDLNRLESGNLELRCAPGDLVRSLQHIVEANAPLAERNGITLRLTCDAQSCYRLYDEEKLEKIIGNLLSNALKFTPRDGIVRVHLRCVDQVEISVTDDGSGIPAEAQRAIFERFKQLDHGVLKGGTGIGLALAKELTELQGGTITLNSMPGEGSTFTVRLPLERTALAAVQERVSGDLLESGNAETSSGDGHIMSVVPLGESGPGHKGDQTTILIIEDNDDVRAYVRRSLEEAYRVLEAIDGESGLHQARETLPDLIVSDVMLPDIDGYEIARQLKTLPETECIPVVMLTARAAEEDQAEGYESGAEVYITKPFSPETLRAAVARLLEERRRLLRRLQKRTYQSGKEIPKASPNGQTPFSDQVRTTVLEHLHEEDFGIEELATALHVTRHTLYNRLNSEMGISPTDFVRTLRLERANELLADGAGTVSEIAYAVGFNSLSVFSRNYRAHYGVPPSAHLSRETNRSG